MFIIQFSELSNGIIYKVKIPWRSAFPNIISINSSASVLQTFFYQYHLVFCSLPSWLILLDSVCIFNSHELAYLPSLPIAATDES